MAFQTQNCGVMVDITQIHGQLKRMVDVILGQAYRYNEQVTDEKRKASLEEDSMWALLQEAMNHYLNFVLARTSSANLGFDYYLDEYFAQLSPQIKSQPEVVNYLATCFAEATGIIAEQLKPAMDRLEFHGQEVAEVEAFAVKPGKLQLYVVGGWGMEEDDHNPADLPEVGK